MKQEEIIKLLQWHLINAEVRLEAIHHLINIKPHTHEQEIKRISQDGIKRISDCLDYLALDTALD